MCLTTGVYAMLTLHDIQNIVRAVLKESESDEQFKAFALSNIDEAIQFIVKRDFSNDLQKRYDRSIQFYADINDAKTKGLSSYFQLSISG